jgi:hypothetical protein
MVIFHSYVSLPEGTPPYIKENNTHFLMNQQGCLETQLLNHAFTFGYLALANCSSNLKQKLCSNPQQDRKVNSF